MTHKLCVPFILTIFLASAFQQDSVLKDDTVFEDTLAYQDERIQVGAQTKEADQPEGHMKQMGEHGVPILGEMTELNYMINGKDFYEKFARKRKPLVFRGVTRNWNSTKYWKDETYLLEKYSDVIFDVETGKVFDADLNTRRTMDMREFLNEYKNKTLYLDSPFPQTPMTADMELPLMLQCEDKYKSFMSMHLLFSNGGTSSPLHHDGYENFLSVFSGVKVIFLMEPKYGKELYADFVKDFPGLSPISPEAVDFVKYPLFKDVPFHKVVLNPGDILYIPQFWFHQVRSYESPNIAASMWFMFFPINALDEVGFRDVLNIEEKFALGLESQPETIECNHQNRPMNELFSDEKIDLRKFVEKEVIAEKSNVNKVELNDEVLPGQPTIYVGSDDTYIYAVDMLNGKTKWRIKTEQDTGSTCHFNHDNIIVYCGADDGVMRAMFFNNGSLLWDYTVSAPIISSVKLDEQGNLYFGSLDYYMYSLNEKGEKRWRRFLGNPIWSTPLLYPEADTVVIAIKIGENDTRSNAYALEMSSGRIVWRFKAEGGVVSSPKPSHTRKSVFICSVKGWFYELDLLEGSVIYKLNLNTTDDEGDLASSPAVDKDGTVYVLLASGKLVAIDTVNRDLKWHIDLKALKDKDEIKEDDRGSNSSPLLSYDGTLYVGAGFGVVFAVDATNGKIKWQKRVGTGIFFSSPRLSKDHVLYIGAIDGSLVALDSRTGNFIWSMKSDGPLVGTPLITAGFEA